MKPSCKTVILSLAALLVSCSSNTPSAVATDAEISPVAKELVVRSTGTRADSLNGVPGHHFGEPRSHFPGLIAAESERFAMKRYYYSNAAKVPNTNWFTRHNRDFIVTYLFSNDRFAGLLVTGYGNNRQLLYNEAVYLLGPGAPHQPDGTSWLGKQARGMYTNSLTPQGPASQLELLSVPLAAAQERQAAVGLKADNE